ncbi:MAG TPA: sortase [Candidatus Saccharimonadales bacterium]|nr:sortase [Candidatus Saccharimonadales bacterium]
MTNFIYRYRYSVATSLIFLAIGLGLFSWQLWTTSFGHVPAGTAFAQVSTSNKNRELPPRISGRPIRISIPSVEIDLKVIPGYYDKSDNSWTLTNDKAQYAVVTPEPNNQNGLTFIYGHDLKTVFYNLSKLQPGATVKIHTTDDDHIFIYKYRKSVTVSPTDTSLFHYHGRPILVLQTCSGIWYQNRQLYVFDLTEVK